MLNLVERRLNGMSSKYMCKEDVRWQQGSRKKVV